MKTLWLKKTILTLGLMLGFAAVASAQTTGDARCANSTLGKYWVATANGGYCASSPAIPPASVQSLPPVGQKLQLGPIPMWVNFDGDDYVGKSFAYDLKEQLARFAVLQLGRRIPA